MEWKPIETAPKDGTIILLSKNGEVYAGWFRYEKDVNWHFIDNTDCFITGCCDKEKEYLIEPNGWLTKFGNPTHWMPLPKPPK